MRTIIIILAAGLILSAAPLNAAPTNGDDDTTVVAQESGRRPHSRWDVHSPAETTPAEGEIEEVTEKPPAQPAAAPETAPAPAPTMVPTAKSDLPEGWESPTAVPPGAMRLEDVKPGVTRAEPQQLDVPAAEAAPAPAAPYTPPPPMATAPTPAPSAAPKSDLPAGWETETAIPPGAVRIEDIKPGTTRPAPSAEPAAPPPAEEEMALPPVSTAPAAPAPAPAEEMVLPPVSTAPAPAPAAPGGYRSDLPEGWESPTAVPPGAVRLEDVKPGTRPAPQAGAPVAPTAPREQVIEEVDVGAGAEEGEPAKTRQRWGF